MKQTRSQEMGHACGGVCPKCKGWKTLIAGLIFLANSYWPFADWWTLIGWLLVVAGIIKVMMPSCGHCK